MSGKLKTTISALICSPLSICDPMLASTATVFTRSKCSAIVKPKVQQSSGGLRLEM